jgi:2-polyprenyl-6-methoxyphenol hydroxylase-like FAD-dependent oxidoreductase
MAEIVIVGAGVVGLGTATLLASDGHQVTVLERDPASPPSSPEEAWSDWDRRGVNQFRLPHYLLARCRLILDAELPQMAAAIEGAGGLRHNPLLEIPEEIRGKERPDDMDLTVVTGRRPVVESAIGSVAAATPGVTVRRGVAVEGLVTARPTRPGVPHVVGVRTEAGEEIAADLVVDMSGRRSALPRWLEEAGAPSPGEELEDSGFMYYGRHFRSPDGSRPFALGPALMPLGTISSLTLPGDNGTWSVTLVTSAKDKALFGLRDIDRWEKLIRSLPLVAHWLDGEAIDDRVLTIAKIEDRIRSLTVEGQPLATGVVPVADAWACSNPSVGRGVSIGMMHGLLLRDRLRDVGLDDAYEFAAAFHRSTADEIQPWFEWTRAGDRHRLAQIEAGIRGEEYRPDDPEWETQQALGSASAKDPDCLRAAIRAVMVLDPLERALSRPGLREKIASLGRDWRQEPVPAPAREELVALANA